MAPEAPPVAAGLYMDGPLRPAFWLWSGCGQGPCFGWKSSRRGQGYGLRGPCQCSHYTDIPPLSLSSSPCSLHPDSVCFGFLPSRKPQGRPLTPAPPQSRPPFLLEAGTRPVLPSLPVRMQAAAAARTFQVALGGMWAGKPQAPTTSSATGSASHLCV